MNIRLLITTLFSLVLAAIVAACGQRQQRTTTPWGTDEGQEQSADSVFGLQDVQSSGELIMLTVSGPDTYYDYHGRGMGTQYLLCERFAQSIGVGLRVEICKDSADITRRLIDGEGDIAVIRRSDGKEKRPQTASDSATTIQPTNQNPQRLTASTFSVDDISWFVSADNSSLHEALTSWYNPAMLNEIRQEEKRLASAPRVRRRVFSPMLDSKRGTISRYDNLFRRHAATCGWDWRLLAAQCYQESCFDPQAKSWAGACGLMQIMPSTADLVGLNRSDLFSAEPNIEAACRYLARLNNSFCDIKSASERTCFVLAAYNGGANHVRDAMALAQKYGGNPQRWSDVSKYVLRLRERQYYTDPAVKYGYMRGDETASYVEGILNRYYSYSGNRVAVTSRASRTDVFTPQPATKQHRFKAPPSPSSAAEPSK